MSTPRLRALLGLEGATASHREKLVSAAGAFFGILGVVLISHALLGGASAVFLVASMGASAVLLFAVPHGPLSQPWPLIGGHLVSALVGVTCARHVGSPWLAMALAAGLAVGAMYYLRCIHPPGGATALTAVLGGPAVHALGYQYVLTPVLLNVVLIFLIAVAFNYPFPWRRYPAALARRPAPVGEAAYRPIEHEDFVYALSQLDSFVDVSEEDLLRIYAIATGRAERRHLAPADIHVGRAYSNGQQGDAWEIREVVDASHTGDPARDQVIYKVVAGGRARTSGVMTRSEFAHWAKYEVVRHGKGWRRAD
ncbi:HPP family protein [Thiobacter aerophilum]|uniref:HPP family protein n=1 Tax=Thiobacter aerophilum TaxID=3121275 RepID=A0ABV0EH65_9BURK